MPEAVRNFDPELLSSPCSNKRNFLPIQPNTAGAFIVSDDRVVALWTPAPESFIFISLYGRLKAFGSYNPWGDNKLRRERDFISYRVVGEVVEPNTVPELSPPSYLAGVKGFKEYLFLFLGRFEDEFKSSVEFHKGGKR